MFLLSLLFFTMCVCLHVCNYVKTVVWNIWFFGLFRKMIIFIYINSKGFSRILCILCCLPYFNDHYHINHVSSFIFLHFFFQFENSYLKNVLYVDLSLNFWFFCFLNYSSFVVHLKFNLNILVVQCHIHVRKIKLEMHNQMQTVWTKLWYMHEFWR